MPEYITIKMKREYYDASKLPPHQVKEVKIVDDYFVNDERHHMLKTIADKAYKALEDYKFKKRNNMPI